MVLYYHQCLVLLCWNFICICVSFINSLFMLIVRLLGCFGKLGSVFADIVTPISYRGSGSVQLSFWISVIINCVSLLIVLILNSIDKANDKRRKELKYLRKTAMARKMNATGSHYSLDSSFTSNNTPFKN